MLGLIDDLIVEMHESWPKGNDIYETGALDAANTVKARINDTRHTEVEQ